ncbi:MAG: CapA family protein [Actinomycetota bacterium]
MGGETTAAGSSAASAPALYVVVGALLLALTVAVGGRSDPAERSTIEALTPVGDGADGGTAAGGDGADGADGAEVDAGVGEVESVANTTTTTTTTATPSTTEPPTGPVTIAFGGDVHFEGFLGQALADEPLTMLDPVADMMADADLAIINLETAITERGSPSAKQFNFRAPPAAFDALRAAGVDVVSMANNHGLDFGPDGLDDSLLYAAEADFPVVGIGRNAEEAYAPWSTTINGQRIAVIGATQVLDSSLIATWTATDEQAGLASAKEVDTLAGAVAAARDEHDTVIVFLHWGIEGDTCPAPRQLELADTLVEAGADLIVGGHAHRVQGGGRKGDALIHYGLGNFVFYTEGGAGTTSGVLRVTMDGRRVEDYEWIPARLDRGVATRLTGDEAVAAVSAWDDLRACTDLSA